MSHIGLCYCSAGTCNECMVETQYKVCDNRVAAEADVLDRMSHVRVMSRSETAEDVCAVDVVKLSRHSLPGNKVK